MIESQLQKIEETLFVKLEEKIMRLLEEIEDLRKKNQSLHQENSQLKFEREAHSKKLTDLISLLDTISADDVMADVAA